MTGLDDLSALDDVDGILFDAGGVFIVPCADVIRRALDLDHGDDTETFVGAHYRAVAALDAAEAAGADRWEAYIASYSESIGWTGPARRLADLWHGQSSDRLWVHRLDHHADALAALARSGLPIGVVSNSDGTVEAMLAERRVCQVGPGHGADVRVVVDSTIVGVAKPDPAIFAPALEVLGTAPERTLYVGDSRYYDVGGSTAAGLVPVLVDPLDLGADPPCARISSVETLVGALT